MSHSHTIENYYKRCLATNQSKHLFKINMASKPKTIVIKFNLYKTRFHITNFFVK